MEALAIGFGLGFLVALQLGPMSLFLIRSTLAGGLACGVAVGAGIALVDAAYAGLGALGTAAVLEASGLRLALGLLGAAVLVWLGTRTLLSAVHVRAGLEGPADVSGPRRLLLTSLGATASNPLTIVSWATVFAAASVATDAAPAVLALGVGVGSATWVLTLAFLVAVTRRRLPPAAVRAADVLAGGGLVGYGVVLGVRAVEA